MIFQEKTTNLLKQIKQLPDIDFKREIPKLMPSIIEGDQNKEFQIFKESLRVGPFKG